MPAKSKAEIRYLFAAEKRGDVKKGVAEEMAHATPDISKLPEHVKKTGPAIRAMQSLRKK